MIWYTAKKMLEKRKIQTSSSFDQIWLVCIPEFKANFLFFGIYIAWFLSRTYWSILDHDLTASIWEKAILILAGNLNSGPSYLITAVPGNRAVQSLQLMCHLYRQFGFSAIFPKWPRKMNTCHFFWRPQFLCLFWLYWKIRDYK